LPTALGQSYASCRQSALPPLSAGSGRRTRGPWALTPYGRPFDPCQRLLSHTPVLQPKSHQTRSFANHTTRTPFRSTEIDLLWRRHARYSNTSRIPVPIASAFVWCRDRRQAQQKQHPFTTLFGDDLEATRPRPQTAAVRASQHIQLQRSNLITNSYPFGPRWLPPLHG
jgi:hypothetical protein